MAIGVALWCMNKSSSETPSLAGEVLEAIAPGGCGDHDDMFVCKCACHTDSLIEHCGPCCTTVPCGLNIVVNAEQMHINNCPVCKERSEAALL